MRKQRFTLIELLVVIAVIAILMGILLPAMSIVKTKARQHKARTEASAISTAIKAYESDYGLLPWGGGTDVDWDVGDEDEYDTLMQFLTKVDMTSGGATNKSGNGNVRGNKYLDAPANFATQGYLDPWGNRYVILMDLDYDGKVTSPKTLNGSVFVYSFGSDGDDDGATSPDDVVPWE